MQLTPELKFSWLWKLLQMPWSVTNLRASPHSAHGLGPHFSSQCYQPLPQWCPQQVGLQLPTAMPWLTWDCQDIPLTTVLANCPTAMSDEGCHQDTVQCNTCSFTVVNFITSCWGWWKTSSSAGSFLLEQNTVRTWRHSLISEIWICAVLLKFYNVKCIFSKHKKSGGCTQDASHINICGYGKRNNRASLFKRKQKEKKRKKRLSFWWVINCSMTPSHRKLTPFGSVVCNLWRSIKGELILNKLIIIKLLP